MNYRDNDIYIHLKWQCLVSVDITKEEKENISNTAVCERWRSVRCGSSSLSVGRRVQEIRYLVAKQMVVNGQVNHNTSNADQVINDN